MFGKSGYKYKTFDILADERIRQWLKFYSNWPTFPQVFLNGEFVGGVDIVTELIENGEFDDMVPKAAKKLPPSEEWPQILKDHKVLVIIEGSAENPQNEESKELLQLLKNNGVKFATINAVQNQQLIEWLKT